MNELLLFSIIATCRAIWIVGFSRRWRDNAKDFLNIQWGPGHNDDEVVEEARQFAAKLWLSLATAAWVAVLLFNLDGGGTP